MTMFCWSQQKAAFFHLPVLAGSTNTPVVDGSWNQRGNGQITRIVCKINGEYEECRALSTAKDLIKSLGPCHSRLAYIFFICPSLLQIFFAGLITPVYISHSAKYHSSSLLYNTTVKMPGNQKTQPVAANTTRATPQTYKPKIIDIYLTDPPLSPLQTNDQAEKWATFWHALTNDKRWSVATGYVLKQPVQPFQLVGPVPDLELVPSTAHQQYATWEEAREKTRLARETLLLLGFEDISGVWNPRICMKWGGVPDSEWVGRNMVVGQQHSLDSSFGKGCGEGNAKVQTPGVEWIEYVQVHGPVKMRRERKVGWVSSRL